MSIYSNEIAQDYPAELFCPECASKACFWQEKEYGQALYRCTECFELFCDDCALDNEIKGLQAHILKEIKERRAFLKEAQDRLNKNGYSEESHKLYNEKWKEFAIIHAFLKKVEEISGEKIYGLTLL